MTQPNNVPATNDCEFNRFCPNPKCKEEFISTELPGSPTFCPFCGSAAVPIKPRWIGAWVATNLPEELQAIQEILPNTKRVLFVWNLTIGLLLVLGLFLFSWPTWVFWGGLLFLFAISSLIWWRATKKMMLGLRNNSFADREVQA